MTRFLLYILFCVATFDAREYWHPLDEWWTLLAAVSGTSLLFILDELGF
jgi:hypothetical protein